MRRQERSNKNKLKPTLRDSRDDDPNADGKRSSTIDNAYDDSRAKRNQNSNSAKKARTNSLVTGQKTTDGFSYVKKSKLKIAQNDFDPSTVKDGLQEIDVEIDFIDRNIPDEEFESDDREVEELIKANKILREKVGQIADLVVSAITKASNLKKQIVTHRDKPTDPALNTKLTEINKYQKSIMKMKKENDNFKHKYSNISYKYKVKEMTDEIKILQAGNSQRRQLFPPACLG